MILKKITKTIYGDIIMQNNKKNKTKMQILHEHLLSLGARELTFEEKKTEWYKKERQSIKKIYKITK